ncbi:hypothetical protein B0H63DRAFT_565643 [Podospora didyma]|uniref:SET domain-containing protein n=1 Tax=Podospora didyma TaxID=330526 RepID=A0AAE0K141_9PEZI|nr:hypothetical protein B0H63DRAFT_565643 [Podospora didyma]
MESKPSKPLGQSSQRTFWAWDANRTIQAPVENVKRISFIYFNPDNFNISRKPLSSKKFKRLNDSPTSRKILSILRPPKSIIRNGIFDCINCYQNPSIMTCTFSSCYAPFRDAHFSHIFDSYLEIRTTAGMGYGIFVQPNKTVPRGMLLGDYLGELIPSSLAPTNISPYIYGLTIDTRIDAKKIGNWTRFMNSHCFPNVEGAQEHIGKVLSMVFRASKDIKGGEQLFIDYGAWYFKGKYCKCSWKPEPHKHRYDENPLPTAEYVNWDTIVVNYPLPKNKEEEGKEQEWEAMPEADSEESKKDGTYQKPSAEREKSKKRKASPVSHDALLGDINTGDHNMETRSMRRRRLKQGK